MTITPEEMVAEIFRLHSDVVNLLERSSLAESTFPICAFLGQLGAVEVILRNLAESGPPLTDEEIEAIRRFRRKSGAG